MAKIRMTRKQAAARFKRVYKVGANELDFCGVDDSTAVGYGCGVFGWNWDLVPLAGGVAICTGYRPGVGVDLPRDLSRKLFDLSREYHTAFNDFRDVERFEKCRAISAAARRVLFEGLGIGEYL